MAPASAGTFPSLPDSMKRLLSVTALALLFVATASPATALAPFIANYRVFNEGKPMGEATMQLLHRNQSRWRVDLGMRGTSGLMGFAGVNAQQSTVFDVVGELYRPVTQSTIRKALLMDQTMIGIYDWSAGAARWSGDVSEKRRAPVPIRDGDMSGLLINLAIVRDAEPGKTLSYRFVDNGRAREHQYNVSQDLESVAVGDMHFNAMRVSRTGGNDETVVWVVEGVPTPVRILQRDDGKDTYDLRLVDYKGAP